MLFACAGRTVRAEGCSVPLRAMMISFQQFLRLTGLFTFPIPYQASLICTQT